VQIRILFLSTKELCLYESVMVRVEFLSSRISLWEPHIMQKSEEAWRFIIIPTHAVIICRYITVDGGAMECSLFEIQR
jgi:hypothetical protein